MACLYVSERNEDLPEWYWAAQRLREMLADLKGNQPTDGWFYSEGLPWGWKAVGDRRKRKVGEFREEE